MQERDTYPAGVPCWVETGQPDPEAALEFYGGLFGWEFDDRPAEAPARSFVARIRGPTSPGSARAAEGVPSPAWNTYVAVDDADETAADGHPRGRRQRISEPFECRRRAAGRPADPSGADFCVWQAGGTGAQLVNEPGTWNFSELNTPDPDGATAFYGAVFGWEVSHGPGGRRLQIFCMPGYGDFLDDATPRARAHGVRRGRAGGLRGRCRLADPDVGATEVPRAPPHWSVTFATDDADAVAERAELGGEVLVPPSDAPWVRMTGSAIPQGAAFTASKFVPPE